MRRAQATLMKSSQIRLSEARRRDAVAIVEEHVQALFRRVPMLCGFSVRQDLELDDVAVDTWPGYTVGAELYKDLMLALAELAEERPDAIDLLRGRTFARAIH
jgi:hypothetical protein